jgi:hypothetical protein
MGGAGLGGDGGEILGPRRLQFQSSVAVLHFVNPNINLVHVPALLADLRFPDVCQSEPPLPTPA